MRLVHGFHEFFSPRRSPSHMSQSRSLKTTNVKAIDALRIEAQSCVSCDLHLTRQKVVFGSGSTAAELMVVGEAPGREEDLEGVPFVGRSGRLITSVIADEFGNDREWCYIANVIKCRPPANRQPSALEITTCRHFLDAQIALIKPRLVISLGNIATKTLLDTTVGITTLHGKLVEREGYVVLPTFHPAAVLRGGPKLMAVLREDVHKGAVFLGDGEGL